jgi:hypothetical protein
MDQRLGMAADIAIGLYQARRGLGCGFHGYIRQPAAHKDLYMNEQNGRRRAKVPG